MATVSLRHIEKIYPNTEDTRNTKGKREKASLRKNKILKLQKKALLQ